MTPKLSAVLVAFIVVSASSPRALAQAAPTPVAEPAPTPSAPEAGAPAADKKKAVKGPGLSLSPETPQTGGRVASPAEPPPVVAPEPSAEWKFEVTGYFRAPMRMSWGPAVTQELNTMGTPIDSGTQLRTPPMVPDANYIDWRYTNSLVAPWTELNFKYGNDRVKAQVQIASYNLTDPGYRRLESNLGINQAFIQMLWPELLGREDLHLSLIVGGFTNRYGAAGRYDAGKYETYLFGRTHVAGLTANVAWDATDDWTLQIEAGGGAKLEPIPYYGAPGPANARTQLPMWEPYPGPRPQESGFVLHAHAGAVFKRQLILGAHFINVFSNDNERSTAFTGAPFNTACPATGLMACGRASNDPLGLPRIMIMGADAKLLGGVLGDGYIGYARLDARNALYLPDAIETIHSFGGWQLHDNYFGTPGAIDPVHGKIDSVVFQYVFSFGQLFYHPAPFWGQGPDLIASVFGMYNHVDRPLNVASPTLDKLKAGVDLTYLPLDFLGFGFRADHVKPNLDNGDLDFTVFSPRLILRTAFVTHEQILFQYSRYWYETPAAGLGMFPYNQQVGGGMLPTGDRNAFQVAAIIWF